MTAARGPCWCCCGPASRPGTDSPAGFPLKVPTVFADSIVIRDLEGRYLLANRFCLELVAVSPEAILELIEAQVARKALQ